MRRWFLPREPDVLGLLRSQVDITVAGMAAFESWAHGDASQADAVTDAEHRADDAKRALQREIRSAFSTPMDPEDIYELSERLDQVLGAAKDLVREAEALEVGPDDHVARMAEVLTRAVGELALAFTALPKDADAATACADDAKRISRQLEPLYQKAMSSTVAGDALQQPQFTRRELYRRALAIADAIIRVGERIWYSVVKES